MAKGHKKIRHMAKAVLHRPRVISRGSSFFRPAHSRLFASGPVTLNPHRFGGHRISVRYPGLSRKHRRHSFRMNPFKMGSIKTSFKRLANRAWLTKLATISGGLVAGMAAKSVVVSLMPKVKLGSYTQYSGAGQVLLGSVMVGMGKKQIIKELGLMIAATGLYDLIASNAPMLKLPSLPSVDVMSMIPGMGGAAPASIAAPQSGSYAVPSLPISPVAALSSNYPAPARSGYSGSYMAPDMVTEGFHGENPYDEVTF